MHFFPKKVDDLFLVVTLKTQAKTYYINHFHPPNLLSRAQNDSYALPGSALLSWGGVHLPIIPVNYAPIFSLPWEVHVNPVHPLATPMITDNWKN